MKKNSAAKASVPKVNTITPRGEHAITQVLDSNRKHLEPNEVKALFDILKEDPYWYGYFFTQYFFGCRVTEPALLLKEDISFTGNMIIIRRLKKRHTESGYSEHVYALNPSLKSAIKGVLRSTKAQNLSSNPWLFPSPRRMTKTPRERLGQIRRLATGDSAISRMTAHKRFVAAAKKAGIPDHLCHTHVLRHTRATLLLARGVKPEAVQFLLGHSSLNTTLGYMGLARSLRLRYQGDLESGGDLLLDGFDDIKDREVRKAKRKTDQLATTAGAVGDTEFSAEEMDPDLMDDLSDVGDL